MVGFLAAVTKAVCIVSERNRNTVDRAICENIIYDDELLR